MNIKRKLSTILKVAFLMSCSIVFSQQEINYLNTVDNLTNAINLPISNGLYHSNSYNIYTNNTYLKKESATTGVVNYDGQSYYNIFLKYDVYQDELVYFQNENNRDGIQLNSNNVASFSIYDRQFKRVDKNGSIKKAGYYEVLGENEMLSFLCKHSKSRKAINENNRQYIEFYDYEKLFVLKENKLIKLSKGWLIQNYPSLKKEIKDFYTTEKNLYEVSKNSFYSKLFKIIN